MIFAIYSQTKLTCTIVFWPLGSSIALTVAFKIVSIYFSLPPAEVGACLTLFIFALNYFWYLSWLRTKYSIPYRVR